MTKPLVFISYSWDLDDPNHKSWVKSLADRLVEDGHVDIIFDHYDCPPGTDFPYFMEQSVGKADKVVIVLTPNYKHKADNREKGVGYEISMISYEAYNQNVNKPKFIPILRKGNTPQEATPIFLSSKAPVDMRTEEEGSFQELLKAIHEHSDKPTPKSAPDWLKKRLDPATPPLSPTPATISYAQSRLISNPNDPLLRKDPHFLGRDTLVQEIAERLKNPDCFALTIIGEPGIGKTDLCKAVLQKRLLDDPNSKVYYLKIEDFDTADGVRYVMAEALGYSSHLQEKELLAEVALNPGLYYFDNLESAAGDHKLPAFLGKLAEIIGFQSLASSREAVSGWDETIKLDELSDKDACLLFQLIWREKGGTISVDDEPRFKQFVKDDLGNHPLSITLTAPQGASYSGIKELMAEWNKIGTAIAKDSRIGTYNRHRNLQVSLSLSVKTVANQKGAIQLWSLASFFPEGLSPEEQTWFLNRNVFSRDDRTILIDKNILRNLDGHLTLLPPVARYAEDMLRENKSSFVRSRFFEVAYLWFCELVDNAESAKRGTPVFNLVRYFPAIRKFMVFFAGTNTQQQSILKLHNALFNNYKLNPFLGIEILEKILKQYEKNLSSIHKGELCHKIGELLGDLSQFSMAKTYQDRSLGYIKNANGRIGKAQIFYEYGMLELMNGNYELSKSYYRQALSFFEKEKNDLGVAGIWTQIGYLETRLGNYQEAHSLFHKALPAIENSQDDLFKSEILRHLGELALCMEDYIEARIYLNKSLFTSEQLENNIGVGNTFLMLAELDFKEKNKCGYLEMLEKSLFYYKKIPNKLGIYNVHLYSAKFLLRLEQNPEEALKHLKQAGAGFEAIGGKEGIAEVGFYRAEAYHQLQQSEKAKEYYMEANDLAEKLNIFPLNRLAKETATIIGIEEET